MGTVAIVHHVPARKRDGKWPICIRVGAARKYSYETVFYVDEIHWSETSKRVIYDPASVRLNKLLTKRYSEVVELVGHYDDKGWPYTAQDILATDYDKWKESESKRIAESRAAVPFGFIAYIKNVIAPFWRDKKNLGNAEKYELEADLFASYLKTLRPVKVDVSMLDFTVKLVQDYFEYLRTKTNKPCRKDSTLKRKLAQIEAVLTFAHDKGVIPKKPDLPIDLDVLKAKKVKLSKSQIEQMETYEWPMPADLTPRFIQSFNDTRCAVDTFLLQYYIYGARISDALLIKNQNIIVQKGKPVRIEYYQKKGRKSDGKKLMQITIKPQLMDILLRYWQPQVPGDYLLPWMNRYADFEPSDKEEEYKEQMNYAIHQATSQINRCLARACSWIDIDVPKLGSHSARRSFAQRAKKKGKPIEWLKDIFGHSSYDTTKECRHWKPSEKPVSLWLKKNPIPTGQVICWTLGVL